MVEKKIGSAEIEWEPSQTGSHSIYVEVNPDNTIPEFDTTNNKASKDVITYKVWTKKMEGDLVGTGSIGGSKRASQSI